MPTERLLRSLEAWRATDILDGAGEPREHPISAKNRQMAQLLDKVDQLDEAIVGRAVIEQAKGVLILRHGIDEDQAFAVLSRWSQTTNTKLRTIAETLVRAVCQGDRTYEHDPALVRWLHEQLRQSLAGTELEIAPAADARTG